MIYGRQIAIRHADFIRLCIFFIVFNPKMRFSQSSREIFSQNFITFPQKTYETLHISKNSPKSRNHFVDYFVMQELEGHFPIAPQHTEKQPPWLFIEVNALRACGKWGEENAVCVCECRNGAQKGSILLFVPYVMLFVVLLKKRVVRCAAKNNNMCL